MDLDLTQPWRAYAQARPSSGPVVTMCTGTERWSSSRAVMWWGELSHLRAPGRTHQEHHRPQSSCAHTAGAPQTSELLHSRSRRLHRPQSSWAHIPGGSTEAHTPDGKTLAMGTQGNNCSVEHTFCPSYTNACSQIWGDWSWEKSAADTAQVLGCSTTNLLPAATVPSPSAQA